MQNNAVTGRLVLIKTNGQCGNLQKIPCTKLFISTGIIGIITVSTKTIYNTLLLTKHGQQHTDYCLKTPIYSCSLLLCS